MDKLSFTTLQLILESSNDALRFNEVKKENLINIPSEFEYSENNTFYKSYTELNDEYFWLVSEYGKPNPHRENWVDIETHKEEKNKRKGTQVELTHQSFLFYSFESKLLYLSNSKHINLMSKILSEKSGNIFFAKRLIVDFDKFITIIESVNKIKFTGFNNLFSVDSKQFKALEALTGTSAPETFTLEATYKQSAIKEFLKFLHLSKQEHKIEKLVICGLDESGLETIYNVDSFTNQIFINCRKNNEGIYEHEAIKNELISKTTN
jgi:hypothetical protein